MKNTWIKTPTVPGFYWARGERKSQIAIAHVGERLVWDATTKQNVSQGWYAQFTPGGVALRLDQTSYEFRGPLEPPTD